MSYLVRRRRRRPLGQLPMDVMPFPGLPNIDIPGPGSPGVPATATPITTPYSLFPTDVSPGDPVNITGNFTGQHQGNVRVRFTGSGWLHPVLTSPFGGSIQVPEDAETGVCEIEVAGRRVFGTQCLIRKRNGVKLGEHKSLAPWGKHKGYVTVDGYEVLGCDGKPCHSCKCSMGALPLGLGLGGLLALGAIGYLAWKSSQGSGVRMLSESERLRLKTRFTP